MRSRSASTERRAGRRAAGLALLLLALSLLATAASAWAPAGAQAAPVVPPPNVADWPEPQVCTQSYVADASDRDYCELKRFCDSLRGGDANYSYWKDWCGAVGEGSLMQGCRNLAQGGLVTGSCERDRRRLAARCPKRPSDREPGAEAWLCEQYFRIYAPGAPAGRPKPPASTTPATPPPPTTTTPAPATPPTAPPAEESDRQEGGVPDVFAALGATSPLCHYPGRLDAETRASCKASGSIAHQYPISHYGLDTNSGEDDSLLDVASWEVIASVLQALGNLLWMGSVYFIKAILLLLEWAFEAPIVSHCTTAQQTSGACDSAMPEISAAVTDLHSNVLGSPWTMAALACAGIAAMWNGLVRQRVTESLTGLAATLALMTAGLVIIAQPAATVGQLAQISNQASLGLLNAATLARGDNPTDTFAQAHQGMFDTLVRRPWCALQFGDVDYCTKRSGDSRLQVADVWLAFEADSVERETLYKVTKGERIDKGELSEWAEKSWDALKEAGTSIFTGMPRYDPRTGTRWEQRDRAQAVEGELRKVIGGNALPEKVQLQEPMGTPTRLALLGLVLVTQLGAAVVLGWIAIRLLMASMSLILLLLLSPFVMLSAGLGAVGRKNCVTYARELAETAAARFISAAFLVAMLFGSAALAGMSLAWFPLWLLQAAFWWGVVIRRHHLLSFLRLDGQPSGGGAGGRAAGSGMSLMQAYFGYRAIREVGSGLRNTVAAPMRAVRASGLTRQEAMGDALNRSLDRTMLGRARQALGLRRDLDRTRASRLMGDKAALETRLAGVRRARSRKEDRLRLGEATGPATAGLHRLQDRRDALTAAQADATARRLRARRELTSLRSRRAKLRADRDAAVAAGASTRPYDDALADTSSRIRATRTELREASKMESTAAADLAQTQAALRATESDRLVVDEAGNATVQPGAFSEAISRAPEIAEIERLKQEERDLERQLQAPEIRWAESFQARDAAGEEIAEDEARRWLDNRRAAIERGEAADTDEQLIAAGIDPEAFRSAHWFEQNRLRRRSQEAMEHDAQMIKLRNSEHVPRAVQREAAETAHLLDPQFSADLVRRSQELREQARKERIMRRRNRR